MSHAVAEITQMSDKHNARATELTQSLNHYTELASLLAKYGDAEKSAEVVSHAMDELAHKAEFQASARALRSMVEAMVSGRVGENAAANIAMMYRDKTNEIYNKEKKDIAKSEEAVEIAKTVWEAGHPDEPFVLAGDDDLAVFAPTEDVTVCPITRMELVDPMRNNCGHVYSKDAITEYLRRHRQRAECPVAGCPGQVSAHSIKADTALQKRLANQKKRKRPEKEDDVEDL